MIILENVYDKILNDSPFVPPETGGILGGFKNIVTNVEFVCGLNGYGGRYAPDVKNINKILRRWSKAEIDFLGIFHTHALNWPELSKEDRKYIDIIMSKMPDTVQRLYFPLVFPKYKMISFYAQKVQNNLYIIKDEIKIVGSKNYEN